jgi:hypothetical protein
MQFETDRGQQLGKFLELACVVGGKDEALGHGVGKLRGEGAILAPTHECRCLKNKSIKF